MGLHGSALTKARQLLTHAGVLRVEFLTPLGGTHGLEVYREGQHGR